MVTEQKADQIRKVLHDEAIDGEFFRLDRLDTLTTYHGTQDIYREVLSDLTGSLVYSTRVITGEELNCVSDADLVERAQQMFKEIPNRTTSHLYQRESAKTRSKRNYHTGVLMAYLWVWYKLDEILNH